MEYADIGIVFKCAFRVIPDDPFWTVLDVNGLCGSDWLLTIDKYPGVAFDIAYVPFAIKSEYI